jgi:hypothetical protein
MRYLTVSAALSLSVVTASAQGPTLKERVAQAQADIALTVTADAPPMPFAQVLDRTDVVLRGIVGNGVSSLSDDDADVSTTYTILSQQVLFSSSVMTSARPGSTVVPISFTNPGGTVQIEGFKATVTHTDAAKVRSGIEVILLLHNDHGTYRASGGTGAFQIKNSTIVPLVDEHGEHQSFAGAEANAFIADILKRKHQKAAR